MGAHASLKRIFAAMLIAGVVTPASAAEGLGSLGKMLSCEEPPRPTQVLLGFKQAGLLGSREVSGGGPQNCWPIEPGLSYRGAQFVSVCAAVDRADETRKHPDLYEGSEVAPYAGLWLRTPMDVATLSRWATLTLPARGHFEVRPTVDGAMIACIGSWFPSPVTRV